MPAPSIFESLREETQRKAKTYRLYPIEKTRFWVAARAIPAYGEVKIRTTDDLLSAIETIRWEALPDPEPTRGDIVRAKT